MSSRKRSTFRSLKILFSFAVGAACVYFVFRGVNWPQTTAAFRSVRPLFLGLGLIFLAMAFGAKWGRWFFVLKKMGAKTSFLATGAPFFIGIGVNNVAPVKAGELVKLGLANAINRISKTRVLGAIVLERVADGCVLALLFLVSLSSLDVPDWVSLLLKLSWALFVGLALALYLFFFGYPKIRHLVEKIPIRRCAEWLDRFHEPLAILTDKTSVAVVFALSAAIWTMEAAMYFYFFRAFGFSVPFSGALFVMAVINFGTLVLTAPSAVGTFEFLIQTALALFSVSPPQALAYALLTHFFLYVPFIVIAAVYALKLGVRWQDLTKTKNPL